MSSQLSLCIDIGASFTKVAVKLDTNESSWLLRDKTRQTRSGEESQQFCFPSIVAYSLRAKRWAFSWDASELNASADLLVLQDWKSVLFHERYLDEEYDPALDGDVDPIQIFLEKQDPYFIAYACAEQFLHWLYDVHIPRLFAQYDELKDLSPGDFDTRICVPDFVIGRNAGKTIERLAYDAGFFSSEFFNISEPKSSLIGILTEGRNQQLAGGAINQSAVFGDRKLFDQLSNSEDAIFFLDIGSFTTDVALANFKRFRSNQLAKSPAGSLPLGIYKLDHTIQQALPEDVATRIDLNNLPATEKFHRTAYNENRFDHSDSDVILLDDGTEIPLEIIDSCIDDFVDAIIEYCSFFLKRYQRGKTRAIVLTGGGSIPTRISQKLVNGLEVFKFPLLRAHPNIGQTKLNVDPISEELVRGASAIGGNSVLLALEDTDALFENDKATSSEVVDNLFKALG